MISQILVDVSNINPIKQTCAGQVNFFSVHFSRNCQMFLLKKIKSFLSLNFSISFQYIFLLIYFRLVDQPPQLCGTRATADGRWQHWADQQPADSSRPSPQNTSSGHTLFKVCQPKGQVLVEDNFLLSQLNFFC